MKFVAIVLSSALLWAPAAWSQTAPAPPPAASTDSVRLELARKLVDMSGGEKQVSAQVDALYGAVFSKMAENMPPENQKIFASTEAMMQREMHALIPAMINISVSVYARNFTEQELRDIVAFRETPTGRAMAEKTPLIQREAMSEMMPLIMQDVPKMMHATVDEICKEQTCTPQMRKQLDSAMQAALGQGAPAKPAQSRPPTAS